MFCGLYWMVFYGSTQIRCLSFKRIGTWYSSLVRPKKVRPPFKHIIQIGDPILRGVSEDISVDLISSQEVQYFIEHMKHVFKLFNCMGLSAPQVGISLNIFLMEFNKKHASLFSELEYKNMEMELIPMKIVINPQIQILNYEKIVLPESCGSIKGFYADVPRYKSIKLHGFNENGEEFTLSANGWLARIIQHEVDHLNGKVYTDIMDRKTLTCSCWNVINERGGKVELPYGTY